MVGQNGGMNEPLTEEGLSRVLAKVFRAAADALCEQADTSHPSLDSDDIPSTVSTPDLGDRPTLTVPEVATLLGVSQWSVYELCRRGELPSLRLGRRIVIPTHRLRGYLDGTSD